MTDKAWRLIEAGDYDAAVDAYTQMLEQNPTAPNFSNRAFAHLNLNDLAAAEADYHAAESHDHPKMPTDAYRRWIGVVKWVSGDVENAAEIWSALLTDHENGKIRYTDGAGGVKTAMLALYAAVTTKDANFAERAMRRLQKLAATNRASWWPGPIGQFLTGVIDSTALLEAAGQSVELRNRRECEAHFAIALAARIAADETAAREHFMRASQHDGSFESEYYLARGEV